MILLSEAGENIKLFVKFEKNDKLHSKNNSEQSFSLSFFKNIH